MTDSTTHIDTLHVQAPEEAAQQVELRLSTKLAGADLRPPSLAPSQVLLVRELSDPDPGRLGLENAGPTLDRTWERAVRDALNDCHRRAVRHTGGRVPPGAEAVLFCDAAEAWACWCRERLDSEAADGRSWWVRSLVSASDAPSASSPGIQASAGGDGASHGAAARPSGASVHDLPDVAAVWRAHPRLVPAMAAHLATWEAVTDVLGVVSDVKVKAILRAVCSAFGASPPERALSPSSAEPPTRSRSDRDRPPKASGPPHTTGEDAESPDARPRSMRDRPSDADTPPSEAGRDPTRSDDPGERSVEHDAAGDASARLPTPPWRPFVEQVAGPKTRSAVARLSPAHRQLLGVALALHERPTVVRTRTFQTAWGEWREAVEQSSGNQRPSSAVPSGESVPSGEEASTSEARSTADRQPDRADPTPSGRRSAGDDRLSTSADRPGDRGSDGRATRGTEGGEDDGGGEPGWTDPYTATDLGGVFYLVNVLTALDLPESALTPPVGEHVGAWAVLEVLARGLLGSDDGHSNDPLWHVLAGFDGRPVDTPAGRALDEALREAEDPRAYRMPPEWLDPPPEDSPLTGSWAVTDGRVRVWTDLGCVADRAVKGDPVAQAQAEWDRLSLEEPFRRTDATDAMPLAPKPPNCGPALAHWARRAAPYLRARLAAALGEARATADWIADLFTVRARLYTTDTHVDVVFPLDAARTDARFAGLDRSPGWWATGGRVVRFHFVEESE